MKKTTCFACALALAAVMWSSAPTGAAPRCYPNSRYVVASGGVVNDTLTGLVWQQQASATTMSWLAAGNYCTGLGSGFRLPTIKELDSLVDLTVTSGATINQTAFPSAPADLYWASTIDAGNPSTYAYCVDFRVSGESGISQMSNPYRARCVHR